MLVFAWDDVVCKRFQVLDWFQRDYLVIAFLDGSHTIKRAVRAEGELCSQHGHDLNSLR